MVKPHPTYRLIALFLALLMFTTSAGFAIDMHYCQDELKSYRLFGEAENCHEKAEAKACPHHAKMEMEKEGRAMERDGCCHNETLLLQADQDQSTQSFEYAVNKPLQQFLAAYIVAFHKGLQLEEAQKADFLHYKPPSISRDISVLTQSFLL